MKSIPGKQRPKPDVLERVISRLSVEGNGSRVADVIASGIFKESDQFGKVISDLGARKEQMYHPAADQIFFAEDLVKSGVLRRAVSNSSRRYQSALIWISVSRMIRVKCTLTR
ncbi:hypothetical protein R2F25_20320 [Streptomyces sp. UP1A-1]|nr:hypothetical protein [Streptomyces sp. UP1A-1]